MDRLKKIIEKIEKTLQYSGTEISFDNDKVEKYYRDALEQIKKDLRKAVKK